MARMSELRGGEVDIGCGQFPRGWISLEKSRRYQIDSLVRTLGREHHCNEQLIEVFVIELTTMKPAQQNNI
jgi:hypothetical protein